MDKKKKRKETSVKHCREEACGSEERHERSLPAGCDGVPREEGGRERKHGGEHGMVARQGPVVLPSEAAARRGALLPLSTPPPHEKDGVCVAYML